MLQLPLNLLHKIEEMKKNCVELSDINIRFPITPHGRWKSFILGYLMSSLEKNELLLRAKAFHKIWMIMQDDLSSNYTNLEQFLHLFIESTLHITKCMPEWFTSR